MLVVVAEGGQRPNVQAQTYKPFHPSPTKNYKFVIDSNNGHKISSDSNNKHDKPVIPKSDQDPR